MLMKIYFKKPDGADLSDVAQFALDALMSMGGSLHPEDPMFHSLTVSRVIVDGREFQVPERKK